MVVERSLKDKEGAAKDAPKVATSPGEAGGSDDKEKENKESERMPCSTPVEKMSVKQLRSKLEQLNLPTIGKKEQLISRLRQYEENAKDDDSDEGDNTSEDENTGEDDAESSEVELASEQAAETDNDDRDDRGSETRRTRRRRDGRRTTERPRDPGSLFTIKDVEGSISNFSGGDKLPVEKWLEEFENASISLGWSDVQKVIYAKRLLGGSVKQYIALQKGFTTWKKMKRLLAREFKTKINSATIHAQLAKRKRLNNETPRQYLYAMSEIANQGSIEEKALMQYVIDGVVDDENNKAILYSASTVTELRKNLERYDRIKEKSQKKQRSEPPKGKARDTAAPQSTTKNTTVKSSRCFGCGSAEHIARECPEKEEGPKCFKCNKFGHIAAKCDDPSKQRKDSVNVLTAINQTATDDEIIVEINGASIKAMIDTGTQQTVLKKSEYERIGKPPLQVTGKNFQGFGKATVKAAGLVRASMVI